MDTHRLRQFCVIAETGSLTKAATLLHITHSGLSKAMKLLQEELGCELLMPSGRGLALTEDGKRIYQRAKEFLAQEELLFRSENHDKQTTLKIGTTEIFLLPLTHHITFQSITLLNLDPGQIEHMVVNHELDFGITYVPHPMENIEIIEIEKYALGCYHLANCFKNNTISNLPFVVPAMGLSTNPLGIKERDGWIEAITPRNKVYSVNLLSIGLELTLQGLCAIYIPKFIAAHINTNLLQQNKLIEFPIPKSQKNTQRVFIVKHKDRREDSQFKQLKKILQNIARRLG